MTVELWTRIALSLNFWLWFVNSIFVHMKIQTAISTNQTPDRTSFFARSGRCCGLHRFRWTGLALHSRCCGLYGFCWTGLALHVFLRLSSHNATRASNEPTGVAEKQIEQ